MLKIRSCTVADTESVVDIWHQCGLTRTWNNPYLDIERKLSFQPDLFFVGEINKDIIATAMFGYDGHRGWLNYFAVLPTFQQQGIGKQLLQYGEDKLRLLGCAKVNLQIRHDNTQAIDFYRTAAYDEETVVSFGKRLIND